jgi:hypothetical protein
MTTIQENHPGTLYTECGTIQPLNPKLEDIHIKDIARALSNICRYAGHVKHFYSVAEHSFRVCDLVSKENGRWALLHDASEAYLGDIPAPLKYLPEFSFYREAEEKIMQVVCEKYNLPLEEPEEVSFWDKEIRKSEMFSLKDISLNGSVEKPKRIFPHVPDRAYSIFLQYATMLEIYD